jgi:hypothetical protein
MEDVLFSSISSFDDDSVLPDHSASQMDYKLSSTEEYTSTQNASDSPIIQNTPISSYSTLNDLRRPSVVLVNNADNQRNADGIRLVY